MRLDLDLILRRRAEMICKQGEISKRCHFAGGSRTFWGLKTCYRLRGHKGRRKTTRGCRLTGNGRVGGDLGAIEKDRIPAIAICSQLKWDHYAADNDGEQRTSC